MSLRLPQGFTVTLFFFFLSDCLLLSGSFRYVVVITFEVNLRLTHDIADRFFIPVNARSFIDSFAHLPAATSLTTSNRFFATLLNICLFIRFACEATNGTMNRFKSPAID